MAERTSARRPRRSRRARDGDVVRITRCRADRPLAEALGAAAPFILLVEATWALVGMTWAKALRPGRVEKRSGRGGFRSRLRLLVVPALAALAMLAAPSWGTSAAAAAAAAGVPFSPRAPEAEARAVPSEAVPSQTVPSSRVVVVGVPGLRWADVDKNRTPHLWRLVGQGAAGSMSTRTVPPPDSGISCPVGGWLTVSAGQRAGSGDDFCVLPPVPETAADGSATVPGWSDLARFNSTGSYGARIGLLAQTIGDAGGKVAAIGPGAALAAADTSGNVMRYAETPDQLDDPSAYDLIIAEADALSRAWLGGDMASSAAHVPASLSDAQRRRAVEAADSEVGRILRITPRGATVLVAGLSDVSTTAHLHVAIAAQIPTQLGVGRAGAVGGVEASTRWAGTLTSSATRQDALVTITDLAATVFALLDVPSPEGTVGRAWTSEGGGAAGSGATSSTHAVSPPTSTSALPSTGSAASAPTASGASAPTENGTPAPDKNGASAPDASAKSGPATAGTGETPGTAVAAGGVPDSVIRERVAELADADVASQVLREVRAPFFALFVALQVLFYGVATLAIRRRPGRERVFAAMRAVGVVSGGVAVSTFLAQLVPWWSLPHPMAWLVVTILGFAGAIAALAFAGPWRRDVLGPLTVVAGVTSLALLIDVATGSRLQVNAVTGYEPVTGGRFYGFSNIAFAIYATGTILALAGVARFLIRRGWRVAAAVVCLGYGTLAIIADGWPAWGADFGGVPAFVLGFAVFALMLSGRRVSAARLALFAAAGGVLVAAIAVGDWMRPASGRTHLGAFVQQVIDGEAFTVVGRKFGAMLGITVGNWQLTLLSFVALAFLFLVLARPTRWGAPILSRAYAQAPALRAALFGVLTCALAGFLLNDSGIAIPAMALTVVAPLTLASCVTAARGTGSAAPAGPATSAEPTAHGST